MRILNTYYGFEHYRTYESDAEEFDIRGFSIPDLKKYIKKVDAVSINDIKWEIQSEWLWKAEQRLLSHFKSGNFEFFESDAEDVENMDEDEFMEFIECYFDGGVYLQIPMNKLGVFTDAEAWVCCQKDCIYTNQYGEWQEIDTTDWLTLMKEARSSRAEELKSNRIFVENKTKMYNWCVRVAKDNESSVLKAAEYILSEHTGDDHHLIHVDFMDYYEDGRLAYNLIAKHARDDSDKNVAGETAYWLIANNVAELYS
jgi:hypothetical protein